MKNPDSLVVFCNGILTDATICKLIIAFNLIQLQFFFYLHDLCRDIEELFLTDRVQLSESMLRLIILETVFLFIDQDFHEPD